MSKILMSVPEFIFFFFPFDFLIVSHPSMLQFCVRSVCFYFLYLSILFLKVGEGVMQQMRELGGMAFVFMLSAGQAAYLFLDWLVNYLLLQDGKLTTYATG